MAFPNITGLKGASIQSPIMLETNNVWAVDLCDAYDKVACNPYCADEIVRRIFKHSSSAQAVVMSVAQSIAAREFNIISAVDDDYWKSVAKRKRNELLSAMGRRGGYMQYISAKVTDILVNKSGAFDQFVFDGNGTMVEIGGIGDVIPRPYFQWQSEIYYDQSNAEKSRGIKTPSGIWWIDNDLTYRLPKKYYYQTVIGGRGHGSFMVGMSPTEAARSRIWLSAMLEQYMRQVASGTDRSGMLLLQNVAWRPLLKALKDRKESRKHAQPIDSDGSDQSSYLVAYNTGDSNVDAKWVSFRSFPEDMNIISLMEYVDQLVAASYGVKGWRVNPDTNGQNGKFGNASRAQQLDAQEPLVQYVAGQITSFFNSVYLGGMPLSFAFVGGTSAEDSMRISNISSVADAISKMNGVLKPDQIDRLILYLGVPKSVVSGDNSGVASSSDGVTKTNNLGIIMLETIESVNHGGIVNYDVVGHATDKLNAIMKSQFDAKDVKLEIMAYPQIDRITKEVRKKLMSIDTAITTDGMYNIAEFAMSEYGRLLRGKDGNK